MEPPLKGPGARRFKPKYDGPLSNVAFKFNLRHYNMALVLQAQKLAAPAAAAAAAACDDMPALIDDTFAITDDDYVFTYNVD